MVQLDTSLQTSITQSRQLAKPPARVRVLPHFPWSRFALALQEATCLNRHIRITAQITESADDGIITNDKFCCTRHLHLRLRASHRPQPACNNSFQTVRQVNKGGNNETCMDGAPPQGATDRRATALGSGLSTPAPGGQPGDRYHATGGS